MPDLKVNAVRCCAALLCAGMASWLAAAEPAIRNLNLRGLQLGSTTTLIIDGDDLGKEPRLLLPFAAKQDLKSGSTDKRAAFDLALGNEVVAGYYNLRVVTGGGVSLPVVVAVDRLPQQPLVGSVDQLPVALHGAVSGSAVMETRFTGKAGQKLIAEVEAQRLGSKLRPVIHLYGPKRTQIAWSWPAPSLFGDTRLELTLPDDGVYSVTIHDTEYAAAAPGFFRFRLGQWSFVDQVFPPAVGQGQSGGVELIGVLGALHADAQTKSGEMFIPLAWPKDGTWSGPRPFVQVSNRPELVESPSASKPQDLSVYPVAVSGHLSIAGEDDRYRVPVTPGTKLRLEVFAERHGSPLDAALEIRNEKGEVLARGEDSPGTVDPLLEYTVPENAGTLTVCVVDAQGRGGPRGVYRLVIEPMTMDAQPDFQLSTTTQRLALASGGRAVVPVLIERRGYAGSVELSARNLPGVVKFEGATIPEGADGALVTVVREGDQTEAVITAWQGMAAGGQMRPIMLKGHPLERLQPWLATELALAPIADSPVDFQVEWRDFSADARLIRAGKLALPVKLTRPADNTAVRLSLVVSQVVTLLANNQPDPNKTLRTEKPVELGAKVAEGEITLVVPADLPCPVYDVTVQAELLTADKSKVLATAFAPVKRLEVSPLVALQLAGGPRFETTIDPKTGATIKIAGKVERREGLKGDVVVTLAGLPAGARADTATVKGEAVDFSVNVVLPPNTAAGEIKGLKLTAAAVPDPKQPNVRVRSREVDLVLVVQAKT